MNVSIFCSRIFPRFLPKSLPCLSLLFQAYLWAWFRSTWTPPGYFLRHSQSVKVKQMEESRHCVGLSGHELRDLSTCSYLLYSTELAYSTHKQPTRSPGGFSQYRHRLLSHLLALHPQGVSQEWDREGSDWRHIMAHDRGDPELFPTAKWPIGWSLGASISCSPCLLQFSL